MNDAILVSVVIPVYNVENYIVRCLDSVGNQTYGNIECILIDDCTLDNCNTIIKKYIESYNGNIEFRLIKCDVNLGLSGARNTGTKEAGGDYVYYLDSDDEITETCIESLVKIVWDYPSVDMVQGNTQTLPQPVEDWRDITDKKFPVYSDDRNWIKRNMLLNTIPVNAWNKLIRREFLENNNLYFKQGIIHEDVQWMFFVSKNIEKIAFCFDICLKHYVVEGSIMQTGCNYKSLNCYLIIADEFLNNIDDVESVAQWKLMRDFIYARMITINPKLREKELIVGYKKIIERIIKQNNKMSLAELLFYKLLLLKKSIYGSYLGIKASGLLRKIIEKNVD